MAAERLQKILARAGHGSRRSAEALIVAGRVAIDGRVATLGERADLLTNVVTVDGQPVEAPSATATWMLHKPRDIVVSASDERGRRTVYDLLRGAPPGLRYVGRLDRDSEGLLLLTTDGELAHRLAHPRYEVVKTYEATVAGVPGGEALARLRRGVPLEDGVTAPAEVEVVSVEPGGRALVRLGIHEGRKREVRRMLAAVGHPVERLVRTRFAGVELGGLAPGASRPLAADEEQALRALVGLVDAPGEALDDPATATQRAAEGAPITDSLARSVAVDGPTASGKSVVGRALAERLGLGFVDTGLMYRACTMAALRAGVAPEDSEAVVALVRGLDLDMHWPEPSTPRVYLDDVDVTDSLRRPEIEQAVSLVSGVPEVREELVRRQRGLAGRQPVVMAGRDIGNHVLREARAKFFLEASTETRARRRLGEQLDAGRQTTFERVLEETRRRDELDATGHRAIRREQAAADALVIDTDAMGIDQVVETCIEAYRAANPE